MSTADRIIIPLFGGLDIQAVKLNQDLYSIMVLDNDMLVDAACAENVEELVNQIIRFRRLYREDPDPELFLDFDLEEEHNDPN